jgi:hypothetical protein
MKDWFRGKKHRSMQPGLHYRSNPLRAFFSLLFFSEYQA